MASTSGTLVEKCILKVYLKYIYLILSILQIHFNVDVLNRVSCNCTFSILNWHT